jgi:hypothetical protein
MNFFGGGGQQQQPQGPDPVFAGACFVSLSSAMLKYRMFLGMILEAGGHQTVPILA